MALLVHRGLVPRDAAERALQAGDARRALIDAGVCDADTWAAWEATDGGARPELKRYEIVDELGRGGQATVFRARDRTDGAEVALKVLHPALAADERQVAAFVREARTLIDLDDPHIVKGRRVAREGPTVYFAMELVPGECLQDRLDRDGRLDEEAALGIVRQVALALEHLRDRGLVHRDVKPGNVMVDDDDHATLIDLGFAATGADGAGDSATTAGTVHYIAPEQARGRGDLDVRADIYALGASLYHLVTGSLPFDGESGQEVLAKQVLESLSGARIRDMELSQQLHWFIEKMMAKDKEIRFQSPRELADEIERYLEQRARERSDSRGTRRGAERGRRRRRWL